MLTTLQGVYRKGKIVLKNNPTNIPDETPVIVTFLGGEGIDLRARGISEEQAGEIRAQLAAFAEEWDSPEMSIYDNYEAHV
ncbi:MAG: hypothetical protein DPW18_17520 [Chloroflexi bacterium]|nr:hypothetical protein [Chloroflexota bacterium]MDL1943313.1 hypothetical protein [Chloroflexi bacterium CFX2]